MDKSFWLSLKDNDFNIPEGHTAETLLSQVTALLGSPDPVLRDDVAYMALYYWMMRDHLLPVKTVRDLIKQLTPNLKAGIGEKNTDTVLLRSFSMLALSLVAYHDLKKQFLTASEVKDLLNVSLDYLEAEQDLRGYVEGTGWHHAVAHTADVLKFLARNPRTDADDHLRILNAIFDKLSAPVTHVYVHDEDERLILAVFDIFKRNLISTEAWATWLARFRTWKAAHAHKEQFDASIHAPYMNLKHFIRSLYFTMQAISQSAEVPITEHDLAGELLPDILKTVRHLAPGTIYLEK